MFTVKDLAKKFESGQNNNAGNYVRPDTTADNALAMSAIERDRQIEMLQQFEKNKQEEAAQAALLKALENCKTNAEQEAVLARFATAF